MTPKNRSTPPHLRVACAIIENLGRVLAAQRSAAMSLPLKWEFPGGKIKNGETPDACLRRELNEELGIAVNVSEALDPVTHRYPSFTVTLLPFRCVIAAGTITLHEHAAIRWLEPEAMPTLDWAEADLPIIKSYLAQRSAKPRPK